MQITRKGRLAQFFCRHKNTEWYQKQEPFFSLNGDRHYKFCNDCGKKIDEMFIRHD